MNCLLGCVLPGALLADMAAGGFRSPGRSTVQPGEWLSRPVGEWDLRIVMIDGIHFKNRVLLICLGIEAEATKHVVGLR